MNLLVLDTSTEACAVGIQTIDGTLLQAFEIAPRRHSELLPKMLDSVLLESGLSKKQINGCVVGVGPGGFTGIRIGLATIQGIALGLNIPCYAVSSLHAIAQQAVLNHPNITGQVTATIDARMQEIYCADFTIEAERKTNLMGEERLIANEQFKLSKASQGIVGSGLACVKEYLDKIDRLAIAENCYPTAESLLMIYQQHNLHGLLPEQLTASYIRNTVAYQSKRKQ